MKNIELKVSGMMCNGCENRVQNALMQIDGVKEVKASYIEGVVRVFVKEDVNEEAIKAIIEDIGYNVI